MRKITEKFAVLSLALTASAVGLGVSAPSASAVSLVPQFETEVNVGVGGGCIDPSRCLTDLSPYGISSIVSLIDSTSGTRSRLFVDNLATANTYGGIMFKHVDEGTNPAGYWFRPSEARRNGDVGEEKGRLEVGTFTFNFTQAIDRLLVRYFDTEQNGQTGVLQVNGVAVPASYVPAGPNGNIFEQTLTNVSSITLKLGQDYPNTNPISGDGVDIQLESVPEPGTVGALGTLTALVGLASLRKRKSVNA
jgi:hypothetical protein